MAIAVMGDDDESTSSLILRLGSLGFDAIHARAGSRAFARVLDAADIILCGSLDDAEAAVEACGRLPAPYLLLSDELPGSDEMLAAMRHGVIDIIQTPTGDEELDRRVRNGIERAKPSDLRIAGQLDTLERDQRAGRYVQQRMLPASPYTIGGYRLSYRVQPSMILSGDFVDYQRVGSDHFVFYIADVSGHGASSAFVTVILKTFSRRLRRENQAGHALDPNVILAALNRELLEQGLGKHVAMFIGVVDLQANTVTYANAGHFPHAIHAGGDGALFLESHGKPVGLFEEVDYDVTTVPVAPGESLVAFSDGVLECMHEDGLQAKESRLVSCAAERAPDIAGLWSGLGLTEGTPGPDDMTCLVVAREA